MLILNHIFHLRQLCLLLSNECLKRLFPGEIPQVIRLGNLGLGDSLLELLQPVSFHLVKLVLGVGGQLALDIVI